MVAAASVTAAGCIVGQPPAATPTAGSAWIALRSKHFDVETDLDVAEAERMVARLELTYALLASALARGARGPDATRVDFRTEVVCFRSESELREFVPSPIAAQYVDHSPNDLEANPRIIMYGGLSPNSQVTIAHELTHRFNQITLGSMPVWLNEGLAGYYSTIRGSIDAPVMGEFDPEHGYASGAVWSRPDDIIFDGHTIAIDLLPKASALQQLSRRGFYGAVRLDRELSTSEWRQVTGNYAASWALVHMLMRGPASYGDRLQRAMSEVEAGGNFGDSFKRAFADVDPATLDHDFEAYLRAPLPWRQHHPKEVPIPGDLVTRPLGEAQLLTLWARLDLFRGPRTGRARQRLTQALAAAPDDPNVLFWSGRYEMLAGHSPVAAQRFQEALRQAPNASAIQMGLALVYEYAGTRIAPLPDVERRRGAAMDRLAEVAQTASELNLLAAYQLQQKHPQDAERFATQACAREPACWECLHNHAAIRHALGDDDAAAALEETALERLPERASSLELRLLESALEAYRTPAAADDPAKPRKKAPAIPLILPD